MSIALSELEQPDDRYLARSSQWPATGDRGPYARDAIRSWITEGTASWEPCTWSFPLEWRFFSDDRGPCQEDLYGLVAMTAVTGGFNAKQD